MSATIATATVNATAATSQKCNAKQIVNLMRLLQENATDFTDEFIEDILNQAVENHDLPEVVLAKWNKSKRDVKKAKKAARKAKKDPNAPKCPKSAYIRFATCGVRDSIKEANSEYTPKDIMSEIGLIWRQMNDSQRQPFTDSYTKDHAEYLVLKQKYELENPKPSKRVKVAEAEVAEAEVDEAEVAEAEVEDECTNNDECECKRCDSDYAESEVDEESVDSNYEDEVDEDEVDEDESDTESLV